MSEKLVIYVDGSYRGGKGGWGFLYYFNNENIYPIVGIGMSHASNSNQPEILACIKAIENIVIDRYIDFIEIRTDYLGLVKVMNQVTQCYYLNSDQVANKLGKQNASLTVRLAQLIIQSNYNFKFSKASKKDSHNQKVHNLAKHALDSIKVIENGIYIWSKPDNEFKLVQKKQLTQNDPDYVGENEELQKVTSWHEKIDHKEEVIELNMNSIVLCEEIHLRTRSLNFDGLLCKSKGSNNVQSPIVVRKLDTDLYGLVLGLRSYCIAKILGIETIKAFVTDLSRQEIVKRNFIGF